MINKVIHKFGFDNFGFASLPAGKVLSVNVQNNKPFVWVERDLPINDDEVQVAMLVGTGWEFNGKGWEFLGTVLTHNDALVSHCYVNKSKPEVQFNTKQEG